jgi:hypothetical protein
MSSSELYSLVLAVALSSGSAMVAGCDCGAKGGGAESSSEPDGSESSAATRGKWDEKDELTTCTDKPVVHQVVFDTVGSICHGFVQFDVLEGFELDEERYGTIVELEVRGAEPTGEQVQVARGLRVPTKRVTAVVRGVLKGHFGGARRGERVRFSIADTEAWTVSDQRSTVGAVFLPPARVDRVAHLGCVEGHFLSFGPSPGGFARDLRMVAALLNRRPDVDAIGRGAALELAREGGAYAGIFLAEYAPVDTVVALVAEPTSHQVSDFEWGLFRGIDRMRSLMAVTDYPRRWTEPELEQVMYRMGRWAIAGLLRPRPPDPARTWLIAASHRFPDVSELGVPLVMREALALRQPDLAEWLRGTRIEASPPSRRDLLRGLGRRPSCLGGSERSPSHLYVQRGY